ncbi:MAG: CYTH domain-containing protein [Deltaproteobacteria bacterium]|jgi:CYTH domain-containing protein|nr:CYTH domain-containing protein [Deltaproteobacteria bacterium]
MAIEIERKFLLKNDDWRRGADGKDIHGLELRQGYLCQSKSGATVRVRQAGDRAFLTIKGPAGKSGLPAKTDQGMNENANAPGCDFSRSEYEYEIPLADCRAMLNELAEKPIIEKTRYLVEDHGMTWEVDEFHGENAGLILAELELESADQPYHRPDWLGEEVTGDPRYINANLVRNPYSKWRS